MALKLFRKAPSVAVVKSGTQVVKKKKGADGGLARELTGQTLGRKHLLQDVVKKGYKTIEEWRDIKPEGQSISYRTLVRLHRENRPYFSDNLAHRLRRALSWIRCAEETYAADKDNKDGFFMFYWIAFNSAYAERANDVDQSERRIFRDFLGKIVDLDHDKVIYQAIWERFPNVIRGILKNEHVFKWFWHVQHSDSDVSGWQRDFDRSWRKVQGALDRRDTKTIMVILFDRLYELRNQLLHGCATWKGGVNRAQVEDGAEIMAFLAPMMLKLMIENYEEDWKRPPYLKDSYEVI
ncbi:MAG: hypothetical protein GDA50_07555 [Alphaproteobacteria bacterium GM202ARS2]|nr:hypothetical protein [Alphaproteobacteria bacterium GM202ARS2]